jgi:hypothetical protein
MSLTELLPVVHALPRVDKLKLLRMLADDLAAEELGQALESGTRHTLWSPYDAYDAAAVLLEAIDLDQAGKK